MQPVTFSSNVVRGVRTSVLAAVFLSLVASPAAAQSITAHAGSTAGSTANSGDTSGSIRSSQQTLSATASQFQSRFAWNISSDVGVLTTRDSNGSAQHNMTFNVTAPGGYRLDITETRVGNMRRISDASGCNGAADISALTGAQAGGTVTTGSLSLADPGGIGNGGGSTSTDINQSTTASIGAVSNGGAVGHTLTFTWNGTTRSNSCEAAVRLGEGSSVTGCTACVYPGDPSRTQANDGHFVTVNLVNLCGNGVVDSGAPWNEQCDTAIAGSVCCNSNCTFNSGSVCRAAAGVCDAQEVCSGASATCPADAKVPNGTTCRASAGVCDVVETCNGVANTCPADGFASAATVCRASGGVCDVAETCTGSSAACPANGFQSAATVCRPTAGVCDVAENCTGSGAACPGDSFESAATVCRSAAGVCDAVENCTGSGPLCPADSKLTTECRASAGVCDVAENCDGASDDCPADSVASNATVCRPTAGVCDVAENCDGASVDCPADAVQPSSVECRAVAGICDVAENCDGASVNCPADAFENSSVTCRPVNGVCDVAEQCTGTGANCPADGYENSSVVCRPSVDVCDTVDNCTGSGPDCPADAVEPVTTVCRPAANTADTPETCDATNTFCPADLCTVAGTPCDDGSFCTQTDESNGVDGPGCACVGMDPVDCDDVNPCTDDSCDSQAGGFLCEHDNNGICIGANCGNFVVDAGETCDPPNLGVGPNGQQICRLDCTSCGDGVIQPNNIETCDDGNLVSGCRLDKPQKPLDSCLNNCNEPICADPARIQFGHAGLPDAYTFHGRLVSDTPVDFINKHFVVELRDAAGNVIYRASLLRGSIEVQNVKSTRYKNRGARAGGGVYQLKTKAADGHYVLTLKAYGDMSGSVADMTTHIYVGESEWAIRGMWTKLGSSGWKLASDDTFLPVP